MKNCLKVGVTGHRPNKLGGYSYEAASRLDRVACKVLGIEKQAAEKTGKDLLIISGMAQGWDQAVAFACVKKGIPFIAAVPFKGQENAWPAASQNQYHHLLARAEEVVYVDEEMGKTQEPFYKKLLIRNKWIVDNSRRIAAMFDGKKEGGTYHCVNYAMEKQVPYTNYYEVYRQEP